MQSSHAAVVDPHSSDTEEIESRGRFFGHAVVGRAGGNDGDLTGDALSGKVDAQHPGRRIVSQFSELALQRLAGCRIDPGHEQTQLVIGEVGDDLAKLLETLRCAENHLRNTGALLPLRVETMQCHSREPVAVKIALRDVGCDLAASHSIEDLAQGHAGVTWFSFPERKPSRSSV